jgi:hypothetical protein
VSLRSLYGMDLIEDHYMVTSISSEQEQSRSKKRYVTQIKLVPRVQS